MSFASPGLLWLLLLAPLLVALYVWLLRRTRATLYPNLAIVRAAITPGARVRRHVPPMLVLLSLIVLVVAMARPSASVVLPSQFKTIVLAIDTSGSMRATDVEPTRISAAQTAAKAFVQEVPEDVRIGIVEFGATASQVQMPTSNREELAAAVDRFILQRGTATGSGLYASLAMLFPDAGIDLEKLVGGRGQETVTAAGRASRNKPLGAEPEKEPQLAVVPPGSYQSGVIILLSDGRRTTGPDPLEAAKMAADRGVRVYTVGFGTRDGGSVDFGEYSFYLRLDEETLKAVASVTRGEYFHAGTAADLRKVYEELKNKLVMERRSTEVSALFSAAAAVLSVVAGALSVLWFNRLG
ncbi:MAG: VWA domain-containing protein [Lautropia sp.]|nr:VWA domain-containing protein [Lautropia sp.]